MEAPNEVHTGGICCTHNVFLTNMFTKFLSRGASKRKRAALPVCRKESMPTASQNKTRRYLHLHFETHVHFS